MRDLLLHWKGELAMHDHLLHLLGCSLGKVFYSNIPLMLYRNHGKNVTGYTRVKKNSLYSILSSIKHPVVDRKHYEAVKKFRNFYGEWLDDNCKMIIDAYVDMPRHNLIHKIILILKYSFKCYDSSSRIIIKMFLKPYIT